MAQAEPLDTGARAATPACRIWPADPASFSTHRVSPIRHDFHTHPLMQLPALERLATSLMSTKQCRFIAPGTRQDSAFDHSPQAADGRSIEELFRRIEEPGSWVALYNVQTDPVYNGFLREVIAGVESLVAREQPGIIHVGGFIFISAPPSVTPFHIDRENNFWLQVSGRKTMNVWEATDREVVPAAVVDKFILDGSLNDVKLQESHLPRSHQFAMQPGDGVYFPSTSPHMTRSDTDWVQPGDGVSISIGVVFYTNHTRRTARVLAGNRLLRRLGMSPREPGAGAVVDGLKAIVGRCFVQTRKWRGARVPKGF